MSRRRVCATCAILLPTHVLIWSRKCIQINGFQCLLWLLLLRRLLLLPPPPLLLLLLQLLLQLLLVRYRAGQVAFRLSAAHLSMLAPQFFQGILLPSVIAEPTPRTRDLLAAFLPTRGSRCRLSRLALLLHPPRRS